MCIFPHSSPKTLVIFENVIQNAKKNALSEHLIDRLKLDKERIDKAVEIAALQKTIDTLKAEV